MKAGTTRGKISILNHLSLVTCAHRQSCVRTERLVHTRTERIHTDKSSAHMEHWLYLDSTKCLVDWSDLFSGVADGTSAASDSANGLMLCSHHLPFLVPVPPNDHPPSGKYCLFRCSTYSPLRLGVNAGSLVIVSKNNTIIPLRLGNFQFLEPASCQIAEPKPKTTSLPVTVSNNETKLQHK